ncbi:MAG: hypothetical protein FJ087_13920 [Deltaproteobacteria bacterium]|nr:hypothetical protein [Deltaproteobacteria bacterium]
MDDAVALLFRFTMYVLFGLTLETVFAVCGIERALGCEVRRRVPKRYLEGFASLYMIPLHGLGVLFGFEAAHDAIRDLAWPLRLLVYAAGITAAEAAWGFVLDKTIGLYPWDYYADSRFKVFRRGYTLWTLVPGWGLAGMALETYSDLMRHLSPHVVAFFS